MKTRFIPALTLMAALLASPALALDNLNGFKLAPAPEQGKNIRPSTMTCKEFMQTKPDMQMFVSAWYDGNSSTFNEIPDAVYMHEDVVSMFDALIQGCKDDPASTLEALEFDYGGDGKASTPTCSMLTKMPNAQMASLLLAWTLGYVADDSKGDKYMKLDTFAKFGNAVFAACKGKPAANLLPLVMEYQGIQVAPGLQDADDGSSGDNGDDDGKDINN